MASIRHDVLIDAAPARIWDALRDVGAVHRRLLPGRVVATRLEGDSRFLTFPNGHVVRELIVAIDDDAHRLAYAVIEGPRTTYHHASFQVYPAGSDAGQLTWITDVLPHALAREVKARMERAAAEMKQAIEAAGASG